MYKILDRSDLFGWYSVSPNVEASSKLRQRQPQTAVETGSPFSGERARISIYESFVDLLLLVIDEYNDESMTLDTHTTKGTVSNSDIYCTYW